MTDHPLDLGRLEALAKAATPGPWWERGAVHIVPESMSEAGMRVHTVSVPHDSGQRWDEIFAYVRSDAAYIAAANPQMVLELIERVRDLEWSLGEMGLLPQPAFQNAMAYIDGLRTRRRLKRTDTGPGEGE